MCWSVLFHSERLLNEYTKWLVKPTKLALSNSRRGTGVSTPRKLLQQFRDLVVDRSGVVAAITVELQV